MTNFYKTFMDSQVNVDSRFSKYTLYRLAIPFLIAEDKLLYLDGDSLVVGDISEFYNMDLENSWMAGCEDTGLQYGHKTSLGFSEDAPYLNAGVLLWDLSKIMKSKIADKWLDLSNNKFFPAHDQDIFFTTLCHKFKTVDAKYNVSLSTNLNYKPKDIKIIHYAGVKPENIWVKNLPFSELWYKWESEYKSIFDNYKPKEFIPRKIFYCWFGGKEKPELVLKCVESWKKYCPDYEIAEINESNVDVNCNKFVAEAYKHKKYAFVADYFRMLYLYNYGGITLDSDVEILKPLDKYLIHRGFTGQEVNNLYLVCATIASEKGHPIIKMILDYYDNIEFDVNNMKPNTQFITKIFELFIRKKDGQKIILNNDFHLYPSEIFAPYDHNNRTPIITNNSATCHLFQGSWLKK
jgi:lipopolysaccharide biosynthesis glycosyltransferase